MRLAVLALAAGLWPGVSEAACRLALLLALDVSGSVDAEEYALQMDGVAEALSDPAVAEALYAMPGAPVALSIFEWSSASYQRIIQDWVLLDTPETTRGVADRLRAWRREEAPEATGLGAALAFSAKRFELAPTCWQQTLDVSGDGKNNDWPVPSRLRETGILAGLNINALVVAVDYARTNRRENAEVAELTSYFRAQVIQGPDAFIEVSLGYGDYADAMRRKLLRELETMPLGQVPAQPEPPGTIRVAQ